MVETNKIVEFSNLISISKEITSNELQNEINNMLNYINKNNLQKNGPIITTAYNSRKKNGIEIIYMEIMVPVKCNIDTNNYYFFKKRFYLTNALFLNHIDNPSLLENSYNILSDFIKSNSLIPITTVYNVIYGNPMMSSNVSIGLYIGISPNNL
jgi:effector-binding domain-containing protein